MKTRALMAASAVFLGITGVAALFAPDEILHAAGIPSSPFLPPLVQLCAALLLGFAMTNWMIKGSRVGGIYNRPIALGNLRISWSARSRSIASRCVDMKRGRCSSSRRSTRFSRSALAWSCSDGGER